MKIPTAMPITTTAPMTGRMMGSVAPMALMASDASVPKAVVRAVVIASIYAPPFRVLSKWWATNPTSQNMPASTAPEPISPTNAANRDMEKSGDQFRIT